MDGITTLEVLSGDNNFKYLLLPCEHDKKNEVKGKAVVGFAS